MASAEEALEVAAAQPAAAALQRLGHIQEEDLPQEERQGQKKPCLNDRIMVLKCDWLEMVLQGKKTMEIRSRKYRPGFVWLAASGSIYGSATIDTSVVLSEDEFRARGPEHPWPADRSLPYRRLCGLTLTDVQRLDAPIAYWRPPQSIGWNLFRRGPEDMPDKSVKPKKGRKRSAVHPEANGEGRHLRATSHSSGAS